MKATEIDILNNFNSIQSKSSALPLSAKTAQQHFFLTYAAIHFLNQHQQIEAINKCLTPKNGSFSQLLLSLKYMKYCISKKQKLDNPDFHILNTLVQWMENIEKMKINPNPKFFTNVLLPNPQKMMLQHYEELIIYLNYISIDIQKILKSAIQIMPEDLLQLLGVILPKIYYNIILPQEILGKDKEGDSQDTLFYNQQIEFFTRTRQHYRSLCRALFKTLIDLPLKQNQMRDLQELVCRYYLMFWKDKKLQAAQLFLTVFDKVTEATKFSLSDQLVLFFKIACKITDNSLEKVVRQRSEWMDELLGRFGAGQRVGHPKDEVQPFNLLKIRQNVHVEAGKNTLRIVEIYHQYSLLYFILNVESLDINIKLYYLGQIESKVEMKKLIFTKQKLEKETRSAFVATKKGIYQIQFDNSYSWINSKNIKFEYVVLSQYKQSESPLWLKNLFQLHDNDSQSSDESNTELERIQPKGEVYQQKQRKDPQQNNQQGKGLALSGLDSKVNNNEEYKAKQLTTVNQQINRPIQVHHYQNQIQSKFEEKIDGHNINNVRQCLQANLTLIDSIFSLLVRSFDHTYEFQTNLEDKILKKIQFYCRSQVNLQWLLNAQANDWMKKQGFHITSKGRFSLVSDTKGILDKENSYQRISQLQ